MYEVHTVRVGRREGKVSTPTTPSRSTPYSVHDRVVDHSRPPPSPWTQTGRGCSGTYLVRRRCDGPLYPTDKELDMAMD